MAHTCHRGVKTVVKRTFSALVKALFFLVELRGLEPRREAAKMASDLGALSFGVVTRVLRLLRICVSVLRDVTVLANN